MRPYERLADNEFEDLVGDLLGAEDERIYERFRRGTDLGIDLRHIDDDGVRVIQCKHYRASGFSKLKSAAEKELGRLEKLDPVPRSYRFVTSRDLTPTNKSTLAAILADWVRGPQDILGGGDLDALLDRHEKVERRHVKLWLPGGTALAALLNSGVYNRSRALLERIDRVLPFYVQSDGFLRAHEKLSEERVCVISGPPGIGKSTLAQMLVADAVKQGFEPIEVSRDIAEAWQVFDRETPQIFYYDDFLGTTTLGELNKNEDQSLVSFISAVAQRPNALFILTTREYIFKQARALYDSFERAGIDSRKFLLTLSDYGRMERAEILYNHIFHAAGLPEEARHSLTVDNEYRRIVNHRLFNPRLIETITDGYGAQQVAEGTNFVDYAVSVLEDPELIWRRVYESQISDRERTLLQALVTMPLPAQFGDLRRAYLSLAEARGRGAEESEFDAALEILDDSLISTDRIGEEHVTNFVNPSVEDFLRRRLSGAPTALTAVIESAPFFEQMRGLRTLFDPDGLPAELAAAMAGRCVGDLFEVDPAVWVRMDLGFATQGLERGPRNLELRLLFVLELIDGRQADDFDLLRTAARERLEGLRVRWRLGVGVGSAALALVTRMEAENLPRSEADQILGDVKALLVKVAVAPEDYRQLVEFRENFPQVIAEEEMKEVAEQFRSQAQDDLTYNVESISSEEELYVYSTVAEELGIDLDEKLIEQANEEINRAAQESGSGYDYYDDERGSSFGSLGNEQAEIDGLFGRLVD